MFQTKLTKLENEIEDNFPEEVKVIRKFYFIKKMNKRELKGNVR